MYRTAFALCLAVAVAGGLSAQNRPAAAQDQPDIRFQVEINYVEIDAVVTDAAGNFVRDLTVEDFQVLEDGKPQDVSAFTLVDLPVERVDAPLFAPDVAVPDVRSNTREFNGRLYLLLLDDLHTAPLRSAQVKAAARQFIERHVAANDLVAVVMTSGRADGSQDFTGDKRMLLRAVDRFMGRKLRSATQEKYEEYQRRRGTPLASDPLRDPLDPERGAQARNMLSTVKNAAEWMGGIRGRRKSILLIGEGIDYDINNPFDATYASTIRDDLRDAIAAATRGNVTLYTVDPRGLATVGDEAMQLGAPPEDPALRLDTSGLRDELRLSQDSLRVIAEQTGGIAVLNQNDLRPGFDRIQQENSSYYLLGYYSSNDRRDGRFRNLSVRVTRPGLQVRARKGYVAPRGRATAPAAAASESAVLSDALASPIPVTGLPMHVFAAAFKGPQPNASVLVSVELEGRDLPFRERDGHFENNIELWIAAVDHRGQARDGRPSTLELKLRPETRAAVEARGMRVTQRLALPPGRYQIRVGALETNGGAVGTVTYDLTVPDFHKAPFEMSGVVVTSASASQAPTLTPDADLQEVLQAPPTAIREFDRRDVLRAFAEVYNARGAQPHKVDISAAVKVEGGRSVFAHSEERGTDELGGGRGGFGYRVDIPLRDMEPGLYVLTVEARSRLSGNAVVRRDIPFRVTARAGQRLTGTPPSAPDDRLVSGISPVQPPPEAAATGVARQEKAMPQLQTIDRGLMSGVEQTRQAVIRSDAEWQALWKEHAPTRPLPAVDFTRDAVVAIFLGSRATAGYDVAITGVEPEGEGVRIRYRETRPGAGAMTAQVITSPFHIVSTETFTGPATFQHDDRR
jgi:VWFA-related protein